MGEPVSLGRLALLAAWVLHLALALGGAQARCCLLAWGFNEHAHFSRAFRRKLGASPSAPRGRASPPYHRRPWARSERQPPSIHSAFAALVQRHLGTSSLIWQTAVLGPSAQSLPLNMSLHSGSPVQVQYLPSHV